MEDTDSLNIIVKGLSEAEWRLLSATIKLSQRKKPVLKLLTEDQLRKADVVLIDGLDKSAKTWANNVSTILDDKPVIWIDEDADQPRHSSIFRPVLWVNLPIIISRILDEVSMLDVKQSDNERSLPVVDNSAEDILNILVVDDSASIREHLASLLQSKGNKVTTAENGEIAMDIFDDSFDCVFMDILMPGMDGYEACRKIKSHKINGKTTPVIMLTGKSSPFDKIRGKMAGCDAYLTKPVKIDTLQNTLEQVTNAA